MQLVEAHGSGYLVRKLTRRLVTCPSGGDGGGTSGLSGSSADDDQVPFGPGAASSAQTERILILDEVDSVLKEDTYGANVCLDAALQCDEVVALMNEVWRLKNEAAGGTEVSELLQRVKQLRQYAALKSKYHEDAHPGLIEREIKRMVSSAAVFDPAAHKAEHQYVIQADANNRPAIAYKRSRGDVFSTKLVCGYDTAWIYFYERDRAKSQSSPGPLTITDETMKHTLSLSMPCCTFSVAKLVESYGLRLGVSGTLPEAGSGEHQILQSLGFEQWFQMVDIYNNPNSENVFNRSSTGSGRGVFIESDLASQHFRIANEVMKAAKTQGRPVLVYFATERELRTFKGSETFQSSIQSSISDGVVKVKDIVPSVIRDGDMDGKLRFAVGKRNITLLSADYTRGLDFLVIDPDVKQKGLHVIMSYFDVDKTEEIQAMGRTARQNDNGSFCLILDRTALLEQFKNVGIDEAKLEEEREAGKAYPYLDELRVTKYGELCKARMELVENGSSVACHNQSIEYREALLSYERAKLGDKSECRAKALQLLRRISTSVYGLTKVVRVAINVDATGSMGGLWQRGLPDVLMKAIERITKIAEGQGRVTFRITAYRDYGEIPLDRPVTCSSEWTDDGATLQNFVESIDARGGYCRGEGSDQPEAVEAGLKVINDEVESSGEPVDLLLLLADAPPHALNQGDELDATPTRKPADKYIHRMETDYMIESERCRSLGTRMLCGYFGTTAQATFHQMAYITEGEAFSIGGEMDSDASSEVIANVVCPKVLEIIGGAGMVDSYKSQYMVQ